MLTLNKDLALQIEKSEIDHFSSWITLLQQMDGNPFVIKRVDLDGALAFANRDASLGPLFNRVLGMSEHNIASLPDLAQFYHDLGLGLRIDINPYKGTPKLFTALAASGLCPLRYHSFLYMSPEDVQIGTSHNDGNVAAKQIASDESEIWSSVWLNSFTDVLNTSSDIRKPLADATSQLCRHPGWSLYLSTVDGKPAAAAALYMQDGIASLAIAGTLPQFRRMGCQSALLQARLRDAIAGKCHLIVAQSALGSSSQNNMERAGLKIAYTRAFWWHNYSTS